MLVIFRIQNHKKTLAIDKKRYEWYPTKLSIVVPLINIFTL